MSNKGGGGPSDLKAEAIIKEAPKIEVRQTPPI